MANASGSSFVSVSAGVSSSFVGVPSRERCCPTSKTGPSSLSGIASF